MRFTLTIDCDNAAFEDDATGEVASMLRKLADTIIVAPGFTASVLDYNGNTVGSWSVTA